jgi:hypothetical protein
LTENLPPQAIIQDRETFVDTTQDMDLNLNKTSAASASTLQKGPVSLIITVMILVFYLVMIFMRRH